MALLPDKKTKDEINKTMFDVIEEKIAAWLADFTLSNQERDELSELVASLSQEQKNFLRNRAFDQAQQIMRELHDNQQLEHLQRLLVGLEKIVKTLQRGQAITVEESAYFSPGETCRRAICDFCLSARETLDICVFTISDDRIADTILKVYKRGIQLRIVTDDRKQQDRGSDIQLLLDHQVPLRFDSSPHHMHHKFAIVDSNRLLNGSFNWTRSASDKNEENIVVSNSQPLTQQFQRQFNQLWEAFE